MIHDSTIEGELWFVLNDEQLIVADTISYAV